jgi:hypothetical protein
MKLLNLMGIFQKSILFFMLSIIAFRGNTQVNLVPNFSFEIYDTCPNMQDQIHFATGWSKFSNWNTTPDYYNACAPANGFGVPKSLSCYQPERRGCAGYAGIVTFAATTSNYREQIGIPLTLPLIIGQKYFVSFYAVLGQVYLGGNYYSMPSNNIGILFSTVQYNSISPAPINNYAHLNYGPVLSDSITWTQISGSFIADSAYTYCILGNFDDSNTLRSPYGCGNCVNNQSYFLVDDFCVSSDSLLCNGGINQLPCNTSVLGDYPQDDVLISPNPAFEQIVISYGNSQSVELSLSTTTGQVIFFRKDFDTFSSVINLSEFSQGIYLLKISINGNKQVVKKIIKQ